MVHPSMHSGSQSVTLPIQPHRKAFAARLVGGEWSEQPADQTEADTFNTL